MKTYSHLPQIAIAAAACLLFLFSNRILSIFLSDSSAITFSYGLLPLFAMGCSAIKRDYSGLKAAALITGIWCVNTLVFVYDPAQFVHTLFLDMASITFLVQWNRPLAAGFSAAMVAVGVTMLFGFEARIVLNMLFMGQCILLAMQNFPVVEHHDGNVVHIHDKSATVYKKAG